MSFVQACVKAQMREITSRFPQQTQEILEAFKTLQNQIQQNERRKFRSIFCTFGLYGAFFYSGKFYW